jgi:hypothetical protein
MDQAIATATADGSRLQSAGLVEWSSDYPGGAPRLVWAVFIDPPGQHVAGSGGPAVVPSSDRVAANSYNYFVVFIDSTSGEAIASGSGFSAGLAPLPVFSP